MRARTEPKGNSAARYLFTILVSGVILTCVAGLLVFEMQHDDRIYPGVRVLGRDLGGLTLSEVTTVVQRAVADYAAKPVILRFGGASWKPAREELGAEFDARGTIAAAYRLGRAGSFLDALREQFKALAAGIDLQPALDFNPGRCTMYISQLAKQIDRPAHSARIDLIGLSVQAMAGQAGREVDVEATCGQIHQQLVSGKNDEVTLVVRDKPALVTDASAAKAQIEQMIAVPLILVFADQRWGYDGRLVRHATQKQWALDRATIAAMVAVRQEKGDGDKVQLVPRLDDDKLKTYLDTIARQVNQPVRDARFSFDPSTTRLTPLVASQEGRTLDVDAAARLMQARVMSTDSPSRTIVLPVTATQPKVAMEQMDQLGIRELVGEGISDFKGSVQGRMRNIEVASARFAGIVVPPGETFSFNAHLGDVVEANGYEDAWVIFGDRTVLGPGGGVCQVSTTLFRAAFWGGYPITERTAHTYRVGWYEQGGQPVGLDATVFAPSVDLKFVNDSPAYLLIQPMVDAKVGTLAFRLYGTRVDRTVMMEGPKIENIVPHGPPVYREDPTLSRGTRKQVDIAHDGADVTIVRIIKRGDQELRRDTFFSHYVPWQAVFLIGTKGG